MGSLETIFVLLFAAVLLVGIAQKIRVPYPIALVLGGIVISFVPGLNVPSFDPNIILFIVLPPVLYYASFGIAFRKFQQNWKEIFSLALGLVAVTTLVIGVIFKWMFPEFSWALAFAFGALISPPDAIATTSILKRFSINSQLLTLLEGESLINDASALVLYKLAVVALFSGTFSWMEGSMEFVQAVVGGVAVGFILGFAMQFFSKKYLEPAVGILFSFSIPYITYIIASYLEVSGVLAVVVNGLIGSRIILTHHSSLRRVLGYGIWDIFIILLNCFVFIMIGLQLRTVISVHTTNQMVLYAGYAVLIFLALIVVRMIWVYTRSGIAYYRALKNPKSSTECPQILRTAAIIGWSGMRGIVSLAAAISLPFYMLDGSYLEGRNEVIFISFIVILLSLVIPGLTLPALIRWLKIQQHSTQVDENKIRNELARTAEKKLHELFNKQVINDREHEFLKSYFIAQHRLLEMSHKKGKLPNIETARLHVIQAQRQRLLDMWNVEEIDDKLLMHLEGELDIAEVHIARVEL